MNDLDKIRLLSWALLEAKCIYYLPGRVDSSWVPFLTIPDSLYDSLEELYKNLCKENSIVPTVSDMVDFDVEAASSKLILRRLSGRRHGISCLENVRQLLGC